jgi:hypothetical protein
MMQSTWGDVEKEWNKLRYADCGCKNENAIDNFVKLFEIDESKLTILQLQYLNKIFNNLTDYVIRCGE